METISISAQGAHGGDILSMARRLGCGVGELVDLSSNLSPLGMVPGLREVLVERLPEIGFLPESGSETLVNLFAGKYGCRPEQVLAGNGTTEFIYAVPASAGCRRALIVAPTYGDYRPACEWAGIVVDFFTLTAEDDFSLDFNRLSARLAGGELVFLCNPNNPTGRVVASRELFDFILAHPASEFLIDESYLPFVNEPSLAGFPLPANLFLLCSSSKIYGIPGLRLGFLVANEEKMARFAVHRKPWGVNRMAQVAGEYLLTHGDSYVQSVRDFIGRVRPDFVARLSALPGVRVIPGAANFILCRLTGSMTAPQLREAMLLWRIMIRDCSNFSGLDDHYFRVSLQEPERNARCLAALAEILGNKP
ncbi:pyridoxal phosphate-dependent aminotransferase [Thiovibrio frasassiensis]|uniref:Aminotransferase class I/II-fold pyridoxal phosphate-dependent enzyme n=1 Tax=Thiovibrio frasassiensis TaxID=2984131 RepID=A0A9X4MH39_9BACT|nr:aminotransferase class I/II-fold pyridoxal phosphate-dependent enzyme [Thiovibrio frasassiensis]MDG4476246.1 aminotransferase class I/II-fold pyridoxal phosphate-dependent enzyme [Thiovibrio frasassiensis]